MNRSCCYTILTAALFMGAAALCPAPARAGSCCGGGSATALSVPEYGKAVFDLAFDLEKYHGFWNQEGKHRPDPPNSDLNQYRLNLGVGYRFNGDWQASISLPYVWNDNRYSGMTSRTSDLGDTTLTLLYELRDDVSTWKVHDPADLLPAITLGVGLLVPTGISPYDDVASSFDVTGRGFYRLDGSLLLEKTLRPWSLAASLVYGTHLERSVNREYGKYVEPYKKDLGDRLSTSLSAGYTQVIGTAGDSLAASVSYAYLREDEASFNGRRDSGSGFDKQSIGVSLTYASTDHDWSARLGWNHALRQDGWGENFPTTDIFSLGVRYVFY